MFSVPPNQIFFPAILPILPIPSTNKVSTIFETDLFAFKSSISLPFLVHSLNDRIKQEGKS